MVTVRQLNIGNEEKAQKIVYSMDYLEIHSGTSISLCS